MKMSTVLIPAGGKAPGKMKDNGLGRLIASGYAAYNAKSDELVLLPLGLFLRRTLRERIECALAGEAVQPVQMADGTGGTRSIAERYIKDFTEIARAFSMETEQGILLEGYEQDPAAAEERMERIGELLRETVAGAGITATAGREATAEGVRRRLLTPADGKARKGADGLACPRCGWSAQPDSLIEQRFHPADEEAGEPLQEVHTPGANTIRELCRQLQVEPHRTLKTMFYTVGEGDRARVVAALIRGHRNLSMAKLRRHFGGASVRRAKPAELREAIGDVAGYLGPVGLSESVTIVADSGVEGARNVVVGANRPDCHSTGACWGRDFRAQTVTDLALLEPGLPCPACGDTLEEASLRPLATLQLQTEPLTGKDMVRKKGRDGVTEYAYRWAGEIDLGQLAASLGDRLRERPLPEGFAPFDVCVVPAESGAGPTWERALQLIERLRRAGLQVLLDDRGLDGEVKFSQAERLAIPFRVLIGKETADGHAELYRPDGTWEELPVQSVGDELCGCR
ncbi:MAG: hypothetical protein K9L28_09360 [Synergistales bacterium]|nr:hypothetical protein [Synergistales bacterium]